MRWCRERSSRGLTARWTPSRLCVGPAGPIAEPILALPKDPKGRAHRSGEPRPLVSRRFYESYPCPAVSGRGCEARSVAMSTSRRRERQPRRGAGSAAGGRQSRRASSTSPRAGTGLSGRKDRCRAEFPALADGRSSRRRPGKARFRRVLRVTRRTRARFPRISRVLEVVFVGFGACPASPTPPWRVSTHVARPATGSAGQRARSATPRSRGKRQNARLRRRTGP